MSGWLWGALYLAGSALVLTKAQWQAVRAGNRPQLVGSLIVVLFWPLLFMAFAIRWLRIRYIINKTLKNRENLRKDRSQR